jgi:hypothetical protein
MKHKGTDFIMHGLFVDDMMHVPTCDRLRDEFLELNQKDFEITGRGLMVNIPRHGGGTTRQSNQTTS